MEYLHFYQDLLLTRFRGGVGNKREFNSTNPYFCLLFWSAIARNKCCCIVTTYTERILFKILSNTNTSWCWGENNFFLLKFFEWLSLRQRYAIWCPPIILDSNSKKSLPLAMLLKVNRCLKFKAYGKHQGVYLWHRRQ